MHASLTTTQGSLDGLATVAAMAGDTMLQWLKDVDGFEGLLMLSDPESGTTQVITFWESEEAAERNRVARMRLRDRITATVDVEVRETRMYEVAFAHLRKLREPHQPD